MKKPATGLARALFFKISGLLFGHRHVVKRGCEAFERCFDQHCLIRGLRRGDHEERAIASLERVNVLLREPDACKTPDDRTKRVVVGLRRALIDIHLQA